jgi:signal transduction histidine kinase
MAPGKKQPRPPGPVDPRDQLELINRLHVALRASLQIEDLQDIMLATVVSEAGLGFDRAFLFVHDARTEMFHGARAMGAESPERHRAVRKEIRAEQQWFSRRVGEAGSQALLDRGDLELARGLEGLQSHSFWVDTIQQFAQDNPLEEQIVKLRHRCDCSQARKTGKTLCRVVRAQGPVEWSRRDRLDPAALNRLIGRPAIAAPLRTRSGLHGVLAADLAFSDAERIPRGMRGLFEWFVEQASTALGNAEMYSSQEAAFSQLQEIETLKNNFLSTISHELRTPLTAIIGFAQVLVDGRAGGMAEDQKEFLSRILRHAEHLTDMVEDLLEISEIGAGADADLPLGPVDPLAALMNATSRLEHRMKAKQITVEPRVVGRVPLVLAHALSLERVLFHLLDNAVKFSPNNSVVAVEFHTRADRLGIDIVDHGIGISEEDLRRIFDGFFQVDNRLSRGYEGLGIGLTATRKMLEAMEGAIQVESQVGQGSRFGIEFQIAPDEEASHGA